MEMIQKIKKISKINRHLKKTSKKIKIHLKMYVKNLQIELQFVKLTKTTKTKK